MPSTIENYARLLCTAAPGPDFEGKLAKLRQAVIDAADTIGTEAYRGDARAQYEREGEIEIDDECVVSQSEFGAYVAAWVWVDKHEDAGDD